MAEEQFQVGVKALITNSEGLFFAARKPGDCPGGCWDIPGGRIDGGENIQQTMKRELWEELGIRSFEVKGLRDVVIAKIKIGSEKQSVRLLLVVYDCELPKSAQIKLGEEFLEYEWVNKVRLKELLHNKFPEEFLK